ncbi:PQQ-like beta-propeller repeat protein [Myxococcota bacterium]|nr:PQQ-like beta-propeller repeat protein [Myxococcota bacterium]
MRGILRNLIVLVGVGVVGCSSPIEVEWKYALGSRSVSTPLVADSFIALGHETGVTILEKNGSFRCTFKTHQEVIAAPKTDGERIFFGSTNYIVYAIDSKCTQVWSFPTRDRIKSDPLLKGGMLYISSYDGHLYALNSADGKPVWTFPAYETEKPAKPEESAAVAAVPSVLPVEGTVVKPVIKLPEQPLDVGDFSYSSATIDSLGVIYLGNLDGYLYAIRSQDGMMLWRFKAESAVTSSPLVDRDMVYVGSNDGNLYALKLKMTIGEAGSKNAGQVVELKGQMAWKFHTQDWVNSSPRLHNGTLYIGGNDRHIYALDPIKGKPKWKFETEGPEISIPVVYKNLIFGAGGSGDGSVYALDSANGELFWKYKTEGKIESDPVIEGDTLYISSADGFLYAFKIKNTVVTK